MTKFVNKGIFCSEIFSIFKLIKQPKEKVTVVLIFILNSQLIEVEKCPEY